MSDLPILPVSAPEMDSQTLAEASDWYRDSVSKISSCLDAELSSHEQLVDAWNMKCRLRLIAALSLYDPELVEDFFKAFPLPSVPQLLDLAHANASDDLGRFALTIVLGLSDAEKHAFPATVGDAVGMTIRNVDGKSFVMTEEGWREQERIKATPLLPHPNMLASEIFPTSSVWADAPEMTDDGYGSPAPVLLQAQDSLWLTYPLVEPESFATVVFEGYVEHQASQLDPDTLRNHPYASAGLKPFAFNLLSESLQSIYWAPLRAKHWVVSLPSGTLDVVARTVRIVVSDASASDATQALRSALEVFVP
jgi:hypothetical protein